MDEAPSPPPLDIVMNKRLPAHGLDGLGIEKHVLLGSHLPARQGNPDKAVSVDRSAPKLETVLEWTTIRETEGNIRGWLGPNNRRVTSESSRRWASAKGAVAILLTASFVLLVLSAAICSG
jgi:hypothetical protein